MAANPKPDDLELLYRHAGSDYEPTPPDAVLVKTYQQIYDLEPDGDLGPVTSEHLHRKRFCAVKDRLSQGTTRARWDHTNWTGTRWKDGVPRALELTYCVPKIPGLSQQAAYEAAEEAASWAEDVCALVFRRVDDPRAANLVEEVGYIDGPGGTLGYHYLPMGREDAQSKLNGMYGSEEQWTYDFFMRVFFHEAFGHGTGLEHGSDGIMAPHYIPGARLTEWGIRELQLRYGPKVTNGTPPTPADPTNKFRFAIPDPGVYELKLSKVG